MKGQNFMAEQGHFESDGTTGKPKGANLNVSCVMSDLLQTQFKLCPFQTLIRLPEKISQCDEVLQFFESTPEDINPDLGNSG